METLPPLPLREDLARVEVRLLGLPTRRQLGTAHDRSPSTSRQLVVVGVETIDGAQGWGECSALNEPTYTHEWAADSFDRLAAWAAGGSSPSPSAFPMAAAGIEMAGLDALLRAEGRSLAEAVGATGRSVTAGATIGLGEVESSIRQAEHLIEAGYRKLKIKVDPTQVDAVPHELSHRFPPDGEPAVEVHVDANGSLGEEHLMALLGLTWHGVSAIEQPFPVDRPDLAAELMLATDAVLVADEAVTSLSAAEQLLGHLAMRAIAIKPARLGGIQSALDLLTWCQHHEVGASIGGMLECGLGRHSLAALAGCEGFTVTGDLSPAGQWLVEDPWPDVDMVEGQILAPSHAGVAPLPDIELLDRLTLRRAGRPAV